LCSVKAQDNFTFTSHLFVSATRFNAVMSSGEVFM